MKTARRVAAIATRLRPHLKRGIGAAAAALRRRWQALLIEVRARWAVFASLQDAAARVAALQQQIATAQQRLAAHEERERLLARSIHDGEAAAVELTRAATASAGEMILRTRATTDALVGDAQEAAAGTLREARAAADATLEAARQWVDATLRAAHAAAQRDLEAMEQQACAQLEPFMEAATRFAEATRTMAAETEGRIQAASAELSAKIRRFEMERDEYAGGLAALIERHAETLERVAHLQADVHERLVPALHRLTAGLKSADTSWLRSSPVRKDRGSERGDTPHQGQARAATGAPTSGGAQPPSRVSGEIQVQQINSFHQVKKVVQALSQLGGVETARLIMYADGVATIGVSTVCPLAALDVKHLDGLSVDVVEAQPTRLVVRISRQSHHSRSG